MVAPERKRQQQQWAAFDVVADDDEGQQVLTLADLALPAAEEIEVLIRRRAISLGLETAPDSFRLAEIVENFDAGDAARCRLRCPSAVRLSIAAAMVIAKPVTKKIFNFSASGRPLQRSVNKG